MATRNRELKKAEIIKLLTQRLDKQSTSFFAKGGLIPKLNLTGGVSKKTALGIMKNGIIKKEKKMAAVCDYRFIDKQVSSMRQDAKIVETEEGLNSIKFEDRIDYGRQEIIFTGGSLRQLENTIRNQNKVILHMTRKLVKLEALLAKNSDKKETSIIRDFNRIYTK